MVQIMNTKSNIYSCEYIDGYGVRCAMHLYGSLEEITHHADALGLSDPELVEAIIPELADWTH